MAQECIIVAQEYILVAQEYILVVQECFLVAQTPITFLGGPCVVMNEVFWRFGELSSIQAKSGTRDLQFQNGPRASNKKETRFVNDLHYF